MTMRSPRILAVGLLAAALFSVSPAQASVILNVTSTPAAPGDVGDFVDVYLTNTGPSSITVGGFFFEIMVSGTDVTFTSTTTATVVDPYIFAGNSTFGPVINTFAPGQTMDGSDLYAVIGSGATIASGTSVGLGHVFFNVNPAAKSQTATVSFVTSGSSLSNPQGGPVTIDSFTSGNITITNTPEPATAGLIGFALVALGVRLRSRKPVQLI